MKSIYHYSNYRDFMIDHYESEKKRWSSFSYNIWARKLSLKNNTSIIKIIRGQRNAGPEIVSKLTDYFRFNSKEKEYFERLVQLEKTKEDTALKVVLLQELQKLNTKSKVVLIDEKKFQVISSVWYFVFRQLARMGKLSDEPSILKKLLRKELSLRNINTIFKNLLDLNLLQKTEKGYDCLQYSLNTTDDISSEALKKFHEEALDLAKESIREVEPSDREISGVTLAFNSRDVDEAKKMIREFQDQFIAKFNSPDGNDIVYQLQTQFFPLSNILKFQEGSHENTTLH